MSVNKSILSKTRNPLLPDRMLSQNAYDEILKVDPTYFGLDAKGVEQQRQNIRKNIPLGLGTSQPNPMLTPRPSMPINMPSIEEQQPEQDSTNFLGSLLAQGVASLGAGIQGGDIAQVGRSFEAGRQRAEQDKKAKALIDPKSEESKRRRMVFEKALGFSIPEEYSATDLNDPVVLQSIRDKKMQAMAPKAGIGIGGVRQEKPEKESKEDIKNIQSFKEATVENQKFLKQLDDYSKIVKEIPITGGTTASGASKIAAAQALRGKLLFSLKNIEKTGALDQGMINIADGILGSPDYTRNEVVDARTNQLKQTIQDEIQASASKYGIIGTAQGEDGKLYYVDKNNNPVMQVK